MKRELTESEKNLKNEYLSSGVDNTLNQIAKDGYDLNNLNFIVFNIVFSLSQNTKTKSPDTWPRLFYIIMYQFSSAISILIRLSASLPHHR